MGIPKPKMFFRASINSSELTRSEMAYTSGGGVFISKLIALGSDNLK